ncbi:MAG: transglutaminase family protein [Verrucomicrobiota bacterium JB023]|nr:transglutaminase family protein [Verrucomicrobiota bacterium JB023]
MKFVVNAELAYEVNQRSTLLLCIHAYSTSNQLLSNEIFTTTRGATCDFFPLEAGQNRYVRIDTHDLSELLITYSVDVETNPDSQRVVDIDSVPITDVSPEALPYLFPSRYCESDELGPDAFRLFGNILGPLQKAKAVADWIFNNVTYQAGASDSSTTAMDTYRTRQGVCRDFAHLGIAFCRALSIPARYFAGYAANMHPQDFHACFEICVGNEWFLIDPTRMSHPLGMVRIATGFDAANTSVATIFGDVQLTRSSVDCQPAEGQILTPESLEGRVISLEP